VLFPPPGSVFASPGGALAREEGAPAAAAAETTLTTPAAPAGPATAPAAPAAAAPATPAAAPAALDRDELYADFMRRLRRDVLEQREQLGDL
jgi:2-oxoglutarate dehydrogenase E2 component (dihydrolipoamide succinyltransferase)